MPPTFGRHEEFIKGRLRPSKKHVDTELLVTHAAYLWMTAQLQVLLSHQLLTAKHWSHRRLANSTNVPSLIINQPISNAQNAGSEFDWRWWMASVACREASLTFNVVKIRERHRTCRTDSFIFIYVNLFTSLLVYFFITTQECLCSHFRTDGEGKFPSFNILDKHWNVKVSSTNDITAAAEPGSWRLYLVKIRWVGENKL